MKRFTDRQLSSEDISFASTVCEALLDDPEGAARLLVYMRELLARNGVVIALFAEPDNMSADARRRWLLTIAGLGIAAEYDRTHQETPCRTD